MAQSAFAKAFKNKAKTFDKTKGFKHRTGKSFGKVDVPDGSYTCLVTLDASVPTKGSMEGVPIVRANAEISAGTHKGLEPSQSYFCEGKPLPQGKDEMPTAEQQLMGLLAFLLPDINEDDITIDNIDQIIAEVNSRKPLVLVGIRTTKSKKTEKEYQNLFFNKLIQDITTEDTTSSQEPDPSDPVDAETTPSDETATVADADAPAYVPGKGDMVSIDGEDGEWEVKQVSQARQTANLEDENGERKNGISWLSLDLL